MFDIVLYQPEIPPNTGNIIRLAANTGCRLHLVKPLGFVISERRVRRAGLDYAEMANVIQHEDWPRCRASLNRGRLQGARWFAFTTRATRHYSDAAFERGDVLVFGPETRGLPPEVLETFPVEQRLRLPMNTASRSLNLSNAVAVVTYEAWRQNGFAGAASSTSGD
jgi:tRNA (cytidine/uridine-2'-O-)-methyltransferase